MGKIKTNPRPDTLPLYEAARIREWDAFTIAHTPISSFDLMERASTSFVRRYLEIFSREHPVYVFCGSGNNGGDGLAIARLLVQSGVDARVFLFNAERVSADCQRNLDHWQNSGKPVTLLSSAADFPAINHNVVCIDAIFGTGLNNPVTGIKAEFINHLNDQKGKVVAVDLPSGLDADAELENPLCVYASHTFSFQCLKKAFLVRQYSHFTGEVHILDIGLHPGYPQMHPPLAFMVLRLGSLVKPLPVHPHLHKGDRGHALLWAGSRQMMGAAILATEACTRSGAGLVTCLCDEAGWPLLQTAVPPAMCNVPEMISDENFLTHRKVKSAGIGPGLQINEANSYLLETFLQKPGYTSILDASALRMLRAITQKETDWHAGEVILTPHFGEFDDLFGFEGSEPQRWETAATQARKHNVNILLKGAFSMVFTPSGEWYINNTGNAGMAKGGSGDVLTGLITGLSARGYPPRDAAIAAMRIHGKAGDRAARKMGTEGMNAMNILEQLPAVLQSFYAQ